MSNRHMPHDTVVPWMYKIKSVSLNDHSENEATYSSTQQPIIILYSQTSMPSINSIYYAMSYKDPSLSSIL